MSAFDWKGKPSVFTTTEGKHIFMGLNLAKTAHMSRPGKCKPIELPGSSKELEPQLIYSPHRKTTAKARS